MKYLDLVCDGDRPCLVRCCQGAAVRICSVAQLNKFENAPTFYDLFDDKLQLRDHAQIFNIIISPPQIIQDFPILDMVDYFAYHRHHQLYMELTQ